MTPRPKSGTPRAPLHFLGLACAIGVSTIYFNQPLMLGMYAAVVAALLLVSLAPSLAWLIAGSVALGMVASVTHIVLPIAPDMVAEKERGGAIGTVMMGLLLGILLARSFAGWVSRIPRLFVHAPRLFPAHALWVTDGWRYVFLIAALGNAAFLLLVGRVMPKLPPKEDLRYRDAMLSLWKLFRTQPLLRESSLIGALVFASFSCFWTMLAFHLKTSYGLGAGVAGTFGLVGAAGALVAPVAGRMADKRGTRWVLTAGMTLLAASYVLLWAGERSSPSFALHIAVLVAGVIVLDMGAQLTQVGNQTRIFGLVPSARSRLNTVYMTVYFAGAAVGSALSTVAWERWKWNGVATMALGLIALAGLRHAFGSRVAEARNLDSRSEHAAIETVLEV